MIYSRQPSPSVCAGECGSRCCRTGYKITLSDNEMRHFAELALRRGRVLVFNAVVLPGVEIRADPPDVPDLDAVWSVTWGEQQGGCCPMLEDNGLCGVYEERPGTCRLFPTEPSPNCLVWPKVG